MQQRREKRTRLILLVVSFFILAFLVWVTLRGGFLPGSANDNPELTLGPSPTRNLHTPISPRTAIPTSSGFSSPADQWAETLIERYLDQILGRVPSPTGGGLVWWESSEQQMTLEFAGSVLRLGNTPFTISDRKQVELYIPDQATTAGLTRIATIERIAGTLTLSLSALSPSSPNTQWLISEGDPDNALQSLAYQMGADDYQLLVAVEEEADQSLRIILVSVQDLGRETPTAVPPSPTSNQQPTITLIPSRTPLPTSTRSPDVYLGRIVAERIAEAFSPDWQVPPTVLARFVNTHPWIGLLSWSETGPTIGSRFTAVEQAAELNIYLLGEDAEDLQQVLTVSYDAETTTTRIPEMQVYFQGKRMEEILFWMYRYAAEQGAQLNLAYDDFGASQAIIIIGFIPFN